MLNMYARWQVNIFEYELTYMIVTNVSGDIGRRISIRKNKIN